MVLPGRVQCCSPSGLVWLWVQPSAWRSSGQVVSLLYLAAGELSRMSQMWCVGVVAAGWGAGGVRRVRSHWGASDGVWGLSMAHW